jgi:hypothetical protein
MTRRQRKLAPDRTWTVPAARLAASPDVQWVRWTIWSVGRGVVSHDSAAVVHDLGELDAIRVHLSVPTGSGHSIQRWSHKLPIYLRLTSATR